MSKTRLVASFAAAVGVLYVLVGVLEVVLCVATMDIPLVPQDLFGGFSIAVAGLTLLVGAKKLRKTLWEGAGFLLVGGGLATAFGVLYLLIIGASALDALIVGEAYEALADLRAEIALLPLSASLAYYGYRTLSSS